VSFEQTLEYFRGHGFEVLEAPGQAGRVFVKKLNCSAAVEKTSSGGVRIFAYPGYLVGNEIAKLVNRGYQQFFKATRTEVPATADKLTALHDFVEEFKQALGLPSLYNEALGTVSEDCLYDRVEGRDEPEGKRPARPWEQSGPDALKRQA
jgi:hypothetical protein